MLAAAPAAYGDETASPRPADDTAGQESPDDASQWADYSSRRLLLHTDLPADEARRLVERLERILAVSERYWDQPLRSKVECTVVDCWETWPEDRVPHPLARRIVRRIGGATVSDQEAWESAGEVKATVFADSTPGVIEHELVHAYCAQTFNELGPDWYKEGMAEMARHWSPRDLEVRCPQELLDELRAGDSRDPFAIAHQRLTAPVADIVSAMPRLDGASDDDSPLEEWRAANAEALAETRASYQWSWALCHFLSHNPNYSRRFRMLGQCCLTGRSTTLDETFRPVADDLRFEFAQFVEHVRPGYRVDLCRWEWDNACETLAAGRRKTARVAARRGYQSSHFRVVAGADYVFESCGQWRLGAEDHSLNADGDGAGRGQLEAVVFDSGKLTSPIHLGADGRFTAPRDGVLYLRCRDAWHELGDNSGAVSVRFTRVESPAATIDPVQQAGD